MGRSKECIAALCSSDKSVHTVSHGHTWNGIIFQGDRFKR
jgi:hypothetical protein